MKKPWYRSLFFWFFVLFLLIVGTLSLLRYWKDGRVSIAPVIPALSPDDDRSFSNKVFGYEFSVPQSWYVEDNGSGTLTVYPNYSSHASSSVCKIEIAIFPFHPDVGKADWITQRLSADTTLDVSEISSEDISFGNGAGIKWTGTFNDMPVTFIYLFGTAHAYEIAPSVINPARQDIESCDPGVDLFLKKLILS